MSDKTYNGWTNYETWNAALWMDNDEGSYNYWDERTEAACGRYDRDDAVSALAGEIEVHHADAAPDLGASFYADMLGAALSEVNWYEIAEGRVDQYLTDNPPDTDEPDTDDDGDDDGEDDS